MATNGSDWRAQVYRLGHVLMGYNNGDKRRVEEMLRKAADPNGELTHSEGIWLQRLLHQYRQQLARLGL